MFSTASRGGKFWIKSFANCRCLATSRAKNELKKTSLYQFHVNQRAQMVPFAGYSMPLVYHDLNFVQSHMHTREKSSIFDVSHMLQTHILGKDAIKLVESLTVADVAGLKDNHSCLSLFTNNNGGILDDLILTRISSSHIYIVSNAACAEKDSELMENQVQAFKNAGKDVTIDFLNDRYSLIALQGPLSMRYLQPLVNENLSKFYFMTSMSTSVAGVNDCRVTRCGYTGEDGFEISVPNESVSNVVETLLASSDVKLAGLGARDSLRLEAGLCLYGNDIDDKTTPVEAGLVWTIGKARRERKDFPGADIVLKQITDKPFKKRIGLQSVDKCPAARHDCEISDNKGNVIGKVTSGCLSPCLGVNIAMGYVPTESSKLKTSLNCSIRGKLYRYDVTKVPFTQVNYYVKKD